MSDAIGYGFVPSPNSSKKELPEPPKPDPPVVNNHSTVVNNAFKVVIDPETVVFVLLLAILVYLAVRLVSDGLKA